jgi:chemotaxis protein MotB
MIGRSRGRGRRHTLDIWPGFVDALSTLLLVFIFLSSVFVLAQFFLGQALTGRDEALAKLNKQVAELGDLLSLEQQANADLRASAAQLTASLRDAQDQRDRFSDQVSQLQSTLAEARQQAQASDDEKGRLSSQLSDSQTQVALLNQQIAALRQQLGDIKVALDASDQKDKQQEAVIKDLGRRLNVALAAKVQELANYRSEFFGRLRQVLGNRPDIQIVGDRFVFQSELLFPSASDQLEDQGKEQLDKLADTLLQISKEIPSDIPWILRVDGHTDIRPINTPQFPSNWELSTARAVSVVRYLAARGVPTDRLAATGFGPYQPIATGNTPEDFARNRRIEFKLTER